MPSQMRQPHIALPTHRAPSFLDQKSIRMGGIFLMSHGWHPLECCLNMLNDGPWKSVFFHDFPIKKPPFIVDFPTSHVWWNQRVEWSGHWSSFGLSQWDLMKDFDMAIHTRRWGTCLLQQYIPVIPRKNRSNLIHPVKSVYTTKSLKLKGLPATKPRDLMVSPASVSHLWRW